ARDDVVARGEHRPVAPLLPGLRLGLVALADQEPVLRVAVELGRDERPRSLEPLPVQPDRQSAAPFLLDQVVRAGVPDLDRAGAVLALRDLAREGRVLQR